MNRKRCINVCAGIAFLLALPIAMKAMADNHEPEYFSGCGEIVELPYPHCTGFASDTGLVFLLENFDGFVVGDRIFVEGQVDNECLSPCYLGCVVENAAEVCTTPPGDLTGDGVIDVADLLALLGSWGPCEVSYNCPADLNGDELVNVQDMLMLLSNWG